MMLYDAYRLYCTENGEKEVKNTDFFKQLIKLKYELKKSQGTYYVFGLQLIDNDILDCK